MTNKTTYSDFIQKTYRNYANYILCNRAIPSFMDGMKSSPRLAVYVAKDKATSLTITSALTGLVMATGLYHHGDMALSQLISKMAQSFKGSNNLPLFEGSGAFGSFLEPDGIAAPRYTEVKISPNFFNLFPEIDFEIIPRDIETNAPIHLLPVIPIALINGASGIAVGYNTNILNYSIKDIIGCIMKHLDNKKCPDNLTPYYKGYSGAVYRKDDKVYIEGDYTVKKNTVIIHEIPFTYNMTSYEEVLEKLIEKEIIKSYINHSKDEWEIHVQVSREFLTQDRDEILTQLKLRDTLNENMNFMKDDELTPTHYNNVVQYIKDWSDKRIVFYEKRKQYLLEQYRKQILNTTIKIILASVLKGKKDVLEEDEIVHQILSKHIEITKITNKIHMQVFDEQIKEISTSLFKQVKLSELTDSSIQKVLDKRSTIIDTYNNLYSLDIVDMFKQDLDELKNKYRGE